MRFSENGYFIEKYIKCANCGKLIYGEPPVVTASNKTYCGDWCETWQAARTQGAGFASAPKVLGETPKLGEDLVLMNILDSVMVSICREMGILLMKTSYSTIFNEGLDFTCALANTRGEMIACAEFCPTMIGGMPLLIQSCMQEIDLQSLKEGDVILHNDPYRGGLHMPEHTFFKPVFVNQKIVGIAVCIGHIAEIGGSVPGAFSGESTEIFHEGYRVPPVMIRREGKDVEDVWKLLLANTRTPRTNFGDLRAMIAAVDLGERRLADTVRKYGEDVFLQNCDDLMNYSERRMRAEIAAFSDGSYSFDDIIENDGITADKHQIAVDIHIRGDEVVADYSRSGPQARGPINATLGVTMGATYNGLLHMTDSTIPKNSGCFRPIRVVAPPGSITNVDFPGPLVAGNTETHPRLANIVIGALSAAAPQRSMASESATSNNFVFGGSDPEAGEYFACYDLMCGGWGGRHGADGNDAVTAINGNCRFSPTEVFETRYPLTVEKFELVPDSGGAGQWRGGLGFRRVLRVGSVPITASQCTDRQQLPPYGLFGGMPGGLSATLFQRAGEESWETAVERFGKASSSKYSNITLNPHDRVELVTPGGGGFGDPLKRDPQALAEDLAEGFVSSAAAAEFYRTT
ncbi:hydantoinase B/oxoprolinase family protein [Paraburkholderia tropica]|uniref:hydantoinase B/oxoprolinase family protein n=1 Tax=Paraburkholderia tropica TaxID=92647 RepID=UPI00080059B8|nr:hydantoinase B/oxoprolinase family protein [Paraburkholderia tropica]OBR46279.1 5-oxoprolinase [Paraburkholderia tropica]